MHSIHIWGVTRFSHAQVSLIWPGVPYDYKSMKDIHMAEGDPKAGITEVGIDSPEGIEKARKVGPCTQSGRMTLTFTW